MSQAVEKPVKLFIDAIKLFLILNFFFLSNFANKTN